MAASLVLFGMEPRQARSVTRGAPKIAAVAVALALLSAACGGPGETLTLSAGGSGSAATVRYVTADGEVETEVELPWSLDVDFPEGADITLTVTNVSTDGQVSCAVEGRVGPAKAEGEAEVWCQMENRGDGRFSGASDSIAFEVPDGYEPRPSLSAWILD